MTPEKRHAQPGRRESDKSNYVAGALVTAATDGLFPHISRKKVAEYMAIIIAAATIYGMVTTWIVSRFATRSEIAPIKMRLDSVGVRVETLEALRREDAAASLRRDELQAAMVRLRCLEITDETAFLVKLPCDSLLAPRGSGRYPLPVPKRR